MNDINELVDILCSLGGKASTTDICKEYGKKHKMLIVPQHKTIIESTLKNSPNLVYYVESLQMWSLKEEKHKSSIMQDRETKPKKPSDVYFFRDTVYNWITEKIKDGDVLDIYGERGQRQLMITPFLAKLVPRVSSLKKDKQSGYFCLYEIEIRPERAVVRLMVTVTNRTPESIIEIYKKTILPSIGKAYRADGRFYNKTFGSMRLNEKTTNADIVDFMENAFIKIQAYEEKLQGR